MEITMLNSMAGSDFVTALDRHVALGLRLVDLKDKLWDRKIEDLDDEQAARATALVRERNLEVHCLSSGLGWTDATLGEAVWRKKENEILERLLRVAPVLHPHYIRVLALRVGSKEQPRPWSFRQAQAELPWLASGYADLIHRIAAAGFKVALENEARHCALATPEDVVDFFAALQPRLGGVACDYIWDVQNMWQMGSHPTLSAFEKLRPYVHLLHLKGGRADASGALAEASPLRNASWPVREILQAVWDAGIVDVVCLNPSHGLRPPTYDIWGVAQDDVAFLRECFLHFASTAAAVPWP